MCDRMSISTGIDLNAVLDIYTFLAQKLGHDLPGKVGNWTAARRARRRDGRLA